VVTAHALGLVAVVGLTSMTRSGLPVGDWYPVKAGAVFAVFMLIAIGFVRGSHPFAQFGPANQTTTLRAMLVALVAGLIGEPHVPMVAAGAAAAAFAATALDGVDGWLARRSRMASEFGARFDLEVDALLIMALATLAWRHGKAGWWVLLTGLIRYGFVVAGWLWRWLREPLPPSRRRQAICVVQLVGLGLAIVPVVPISVSTLIAAAALVSLCYSFLVDIVWLWRQPG
jgi:phosphatidylglycerophosphate synthase